ncbi:hypothetical protein Baya_2400 [Bagarius yarrelli]|uniref:Uncharacterized protein n=1 Tax=Bagarius yarrelli TaxID=175774 RepID=A0A556TNW8_BAGYA|nr:hypothetical protein Baya_2400 [Bagarius yarrelli]
MFAPHSPNNQQSEHRDCAMSSKGHRIRYLPPIHLFSSPLRATMGCDSGRLKQEKVVGIGLQRLSDAWLSRNR